MKEEKSDWAVVLIIALVILTFIFAGIWWSIAAFLIVSVLLGWKDRHKGPFPTNKK